MARGRLRDASERLNGFSIQGTLSLADQDLHDMTLAEAAAALKARIISSVEYTTALIARAEALEPQLDAFITRTFELALEEARAADAEIAAGNHRGPLHGVPFAVKDIYDTAGILTSGHSRTCMDRVPDADCTAVARLRSAGAVLMGKLATHEFAHGGPSFDLPWPPARNPWNTAHFSGGSSSGSSAAESPPTYRGSSAETTAPSALPPHASAAIIPTPQPKWRNWQTR